MPMRTLTFGDIHGCYRALTALAEAARVVPNDLVITLGDYVDRGPNSYAVLDWLVARLKTGPLVALRGNHEIMMLRARDDASQRQEWLANGGDATLSSFSPFGDPGTILDIPDEHWAFLEAECREWHETDSHFFVHANAYADMPLIEQPEFMLFWEQFNEPSQHQSGKIMVCGHTPQRSGRPKNLGHAICIDTWAYRRGWLTCLEVATGRYWQANEAGEIAKSDQITFKVGGRAGKVIHTARLRHSMIDHVSSGPRRERRIWFNKLRPKIPQSC
jgi:serine/threonine protein phosphatase 1